MKIFKLFNQFTQSPSLRIGGEKKPFSIIGCILGLISIISILIGIIMFLNDYFSHISFNLNSYTDNLAYPKIDLKNFKTGFFLVDSMGKPFLEHERLYSIHAKLWDITIPKFGSDEKHKVKITEIPKIKCDGYRNDSLFFDDFSFYSINDPNFVCLDYSNLNEELRGIYANFGR